MGPGGSSKLGGESWWLLGTRGGSRTRVSGAKELCWVSTWTAGNPSSVCGPPPPGGGGGGVITKVYLVTGTVRSLAALGGSPGERRPSRDSTLLLSAAANCGYS